MGRIGIINDGGIGIINDGGSGMVVGEGEVGWW